MTLIDRYSCQAIDEDDINSVVKVLRSDFLTQGPVISEVEAKINHITNAKHTVLLSSASAGLHVTLLALGIKPGDLVWTSPITFVSTANAAKHVGARVDFIDINPETWNLDANKLYDSLTLLQKNNEQIPTAIIPVHFGGLPCEMRDIAAIAREFNLLIIEDASHAIGATHNYEEDQSKIGACRYSDACVFSFHAVKPVTAGEGGAITTNSADLAKKLRNLISHGITKQKNDFFTIPPVDFWYEMQDLGFNYRITEIQAALLCSQLSKLDILQRKRTELVNLYRELLFDTELALQKHPPHQISANHLAVIDTKNKRQEIVRALTKAGVGLNFHYIPVYKHPYYQQGGAKFMSCPNAEIFFNQNLTIPLHPRLSESDVTLICNLLSTI